MKEECLSLFNKSTSELMKIEPNEKMAVELMRRAHELGYAKASYAIATWFLHGKYLEKDVKEGIKLLKIASKGKVTESYFDLAVCYETGVGVNKNESKAFEYYLKAAIDGDIDSMVSVGRCYCYGIGVEKSKKIGNIWLDKAETLGAKW